MYRRSCRHISCGGGLDSDAMWLLWMLLLLLVLVVMLFGFWVLRVLGFARWYDDIMQRVSLCMCYSGGDEIFIVSCLTHEKWMWCHWRRIEIEMHRQIRLTEKESDISKCIHAHQVKLKLNSKHWLSFHGNCSTDSYSNHNEQGWVANLAFRNIPVRQSRTYWHHQFINRLTPCCKDAHNRDACAHSFKTINDKWAYTQ